MIQSIIEPVAANFVESQSWMLLDCNDSASVVVFFHLFTHTSTYHLERVAMPLTLRAYVIIAMCIFSGAC